MTDIKIELSNIFESDIRPSLGVQGQVRISVVISEPGLWIDAAHEGHFVLRTVIDHP